MNKNVSPFSSYNEKSKLSIRQALNLGLTPKYELSYEFLNKLKVQYRDEIERGVQIELTVTKKQLWDWAERIDIISADYNLIRALASGDMNVFQVFKFKIIESDEIINIDLTK